MNSSEEKPSLRENGQTPSERDRIYDSQDPLMIMLEQLTSEERRELSRHLDKEEDRIGEKRLAEMYWSTQKDRADLATRRTADSPPIFRKTDRGWELNTALPPPTSHRIKAGLSEVFWFVV